MSSERATILVVDDEPVVTDLLSFDLGEQGYSCVVAATGEDALTRLFAGNVNVLLLDLRLPGISGMDVLSEVVSTYPATAVIIVTAVGDAQSAVEAMKIGAADYIVKPFELEVVNSSIEKALHKMSAWGKKSAPARDSPEVSDDEVHGTANLDAIARGVEVRLESLTGHTMNVIERTVASAQSLGIPEDQIEKWANARLKQNAERIAAMDSLLKKLERNPMGQVVLGMTELYSCDPNADSSLN